MTALSITLADGTVSDVGIASEPLPAEAPTLELQLPKLGETLEQDGYTLSAVTLEDPTEPHMFYEPKPGTKLVAVEVVIGNVSGKNVTTNPLDATLVDSEGFNYRPELAGREDGQLELVDLNPGERARGWIAFEIPDGAIPESIKYEITGFPSIVLQVGVTR